MPWLNPKGQSPVTAQQAIALAVFGMDWDGLERVEANARPDACGARTAERSEA